MTNPMIEKKVEEFEGLDVIKDLAKDFPITRNLLVIWLRQALTGMYEMGKKDQQEICIHFDSEQQKIGAADTRKRIEELIDRKTKKYSLSRTVRNALEELSLEIVATKSIKSQ